MKTWSPSPFNLWYGVDQKHRKHNIVHGELAVLFLSRDQLYLASFAAVLLVLRVPKTKNTSPPPKRRLLLWNSLDNYMRIVVMFDHGFFGEAWSILLRQELDSRAQRSNTEQHRALLLSTGVLLPSIGRRP